MALDASRTEPLDQRWVSGFGSAFAQTLRQALSYVKLGHVIGSGCRRKMRMSGLCNVEMSAFMDGRGPPGNGANHFEPTRTGPIESVARGTAEAVDAGSSARAVESKRPPRAADAAAPARARRSP